MIKPYLPLFICTFFYATSYTSYSQSITDTINTHIASIQSEEEKSITFYDAAKAIYLEYNKDAMVFANESLAIANEIDYPVVIIKNTLIIGGYYFDPHSLQEALKFYLSLETINSELWDTKDRWSFNSQIIPFQL